MARTAFLNISELITNKGVVRKGGVAITEEDLEVIENGALIWDGTKGILWMGKTNEVPKHFLKGSKKRDLSGKILTPAFADCHTHLVFAGSRHKEFAMRLEGKTYQQIAAAGGGIVSSVKETRKCTEAELYKLALARISQMAKLGVGLVEIKSGYGLDWPTERKMLRVAARLKRELKKKLAIQSTFLGAHSFPPDAKTEQAKCGYVDNIVDKMLPEIAREKLADACDVFFDEGYFNLEQSRRILKKASDLGFEIKLHADELADTGGAMLSAELGALSADHLLRANQRGLELMARRGVVAVLLPTTAFYLGLPYAPVKQMRMAGVCMALASDFNPGSSPTFHLPFVMSLAVLQMGMTLPEAFAGVTYGGARAMGFHGQHGHLRVGGKPKMAVFNCPSYVSLIQQVAHPGLCEELI